MFGLGSTLPWFCVLWGLNGILQGWGGPACAKIITSWFATKERGTYWGLWNISHNLGAFLAPLLAGTAGSFAQCVFVEQNRIILLQHFNRLCLGNTDSRTAIGQPIQIRAAAISATTQLVHDIGTILFGIESA